MARAVRRRAAVVGVDLGTLSARAVVVRVSDGAEVGSATSDYPHGVVDEVLPVGGVALPTDWALQVPEDYRVALRAAVPAALAEAGVAAEEVVGIGTDVTACTMVPTTADGTPLNELPGFAANPHAYVKLWKHHAAQPQADRLNAVAVERAEPWLRRYGGLVSSEGELAKGLQLLEEDAALYAAMDRFVEAADWIVWQLCGSYVGNAGTAGYKALRQDGAYPSAAFLAAVDPRFAGFVTDKLDRPLGRSGDRAGNLSAEGAGLTGLPAGIAVAVGDIDAHVTASAAQALDPGQMVVIMGTSTCHLVSGETPQEVPGMCGVVEDGIAPGLWGYEAGQSGAGDIFAWFVTHCVPAEVQRSAAERGLSVHELLTERAARQAVGEHGLLALDWHSGNRSVLADHDLSGLVLGITLSTRPEDVYRSLLEATAFGTRRIIEAFTDSDVPVTELVVAGGLLQNRLLLQIYADVTGLPLSTIATAHGSAVGAAIHAAVAAGCHPDLHAAASAMGRRGGVDVPSRAGEPSRATTRSTGTT